MYVNGIKGLKRIIAIAVVFTLLLTASISVYAAEMEVKPTSSKVVVNGEQVTFEAYLINDNNYFKLRDLALAVNGTEKQFEVKWNNEKRAIELISNEAYTEVGGELITGDGKTKTAIKNTSIVYKDGQQIQLEAYTINDNNYFKLRDLAQAFNIGVTWNGETGTVGIDTTIGYGLEAIELQTDVTIPWEDETYTGEVRNNMPHGNGILTFADGTNFAGQWIDGKLDGYVSITIPDVFKFEGNFLEDTLFDDEIDEMFDGVGFEFKYEGQFKDDNINGYGKITARFIKTDEFKIDNLEAEILSEIIDEGKIEYEGEFKDGLMHGHGAFIDIDGSKYEGEFANDSFHGYGTYTLSDGTVLEGLWSEGEFIGK